MLTKKCLFLNTRCDDQWWIVCVPYVCVCWLAVVDDVFNTNSIEIFSVLLMLLLLLLFSLLLPFVCYCRCWNKISRFNTTNRIEMWKKHGTNKTRCFFFLRFFSGCNRLCMLFGCRFLFCIFSCKAKSSTTTDWLVWDDYESNCIEDGMDTDLRKPIQVGYEHQNKATTATQKYKTSSRKNKSTDTEYIQNIFLASIKAKIALARL